jgi:hypothetical protein
MSCSEKRWQSLRFTDLYKIWQHVLDLESLSFTGRLQPADKFLNWPALPGLVSGTIHSCKAHLRNKVLAGAVVRTCQNSGKYHLVSLVSKVEAHGSTLAYSIQWLSSQQERILKFCPNVSKKQATEWATQLGLGVNERKHGSTEVGKRLLTIARSHGFPCHVFSIKQEPRRSEVVCPCLSYSSNLKMKSVQLNQMSKFDGCAIVPSARLRHVATLTINIYQS